MGHLCHLLLFFCTIWQLGTGEFGKLEGFNISLQEGFQGAVVLRNASQEYVACNTGNPTRNYFVCRVLCREMGYGGGYFEVMRVNSTLAQHVKKIGIDCDGFEEALMECSSRYVNDAIQCGNGDISSLYSCLCNNPEITGIGSSSYQAFLSNGWQGYAHVTHGNTTYSICSDDWGDDDCFVLCRETGFRGGKQKDSDPDVTNTPLLYVNCAGYDNSIRECTHNTLDQCEDSKLAMCECLEPDMGSIVFNNYTLTGKSRVCTNEATNQIAVENLQECKRQCDSEEECKSFSFHKATDSKCYTTTLSGCTNLLTYSDAFVFRKISIEPQSQNNNDDSTVLGSLGLAFGITVAVMTVLFIVIIVIILHYYTRRIKDLKEPAKNKPTTLSNLETENRIFRNNDNRYSNHSQVNGAKGALNNEPRKGRNSLPKVPSSNDNDVLRCKERGNSTYDVAEDDCYVTMDAEYEDRSGQIQGQPGIEPQSQSNNDDSTGAADNGLELTTNCVYNADGVPSPPCESETNYAYSYGHFNLEGRKRQE